MCPLWCWSPRSTLFLTMLQSKHFFNITVLAKLIWFTKMYFFLLCYMLFVTIFSCKYEVNVLVVEVTLTNRPLGYLEDDVRFLALAHNMLIHGTNIMTIYAQHEDIVDKELKFSCFSSPMMLAHVNRCKDISCKCWCKLYHLSFQEKPSCLKGTNSMLGFGDIIQIKGGQKNCVEWRIDACYVDHLT